MTSLIIDCDPGHDDAVAIVVAGRHLDVIGVTTVFGNSTIENTTRNALNILDGAGFEHIPVAAGASGPLVGLAKTGEGIHGKSGLDGATLPGSSREAIGQDAADFIIQASHEHDDLVIIAVAPETRWNVTRRLHQGCQKFRSWVVPRRTVTPPLRQSTTSTQIQRRHR